MKSKSLFDNRKLYKKALNISEDRISSNSQDNSDFILLVGEDYETRLLLKTLLDLWSYRTIESASVSGAENLAGFCPPRLILLDTNSSFDKALKDVISLKQSELFADLPLIVLSGYTQKRFHDTAINNGADFFLPKPLNFNKLEQIIENVAVNNNNLGGKLL